MPTDFLNQMGLSNQLIWGWYFVYYNYCERFSTHFPKWFLDVNLPDQLMNFIYKYSRYDMHNACHCFQVYCIAYSTLKWGEFLCAYRSDYALKLKLVPEGFFQYYDLDENQALGLLKNLDDLKHSNNILMCSNNLLKNYIRFYEEDLAERVACMLIMYWMRRFLMRLRIVIHNTAGGRGVNIFVGSDILKITFN